MNRLPSHAEKLLSMIFNVLICFVSKKLRMFKLDVGNFSTFGNVGTKTLDYVVESLFSMSF
jgi:hypothetical protein